MRLLTSRSAAPNLFRAYRGWFGPSGPSVAGLDGDSQERYGLKPENFSWKLGGCGYIFNTCLDRAMKQGSNPIASVDLPSGGYSSGGFSFNMSSIVMSMLIFWQSFLIFSIIATLTNSEILLNPEWLRHSTITQCIGFDNLKRTSFSYFRSTIVGRYPDFLSNVNAIIPVKTEKPFWQDDMMPYLCSNVMDWRTRIFLAPPLHCSTNKKNYCFWSGLFPFLHVFVLRLLKTLYADRPGPTLLRRDPALGFTAP